MEPKNYTEKWQYHLSAIPDNLFQLLKVNEIGFVVSTDGSLTFNQDGHVLAKKNYDDVSDSKTFVDWVSEVANGTGIGKPVIAKEDPHAYPDTPTAPVEKKAKPKTKKVEPMVPQTTYGAVDKTTINSMDTVALADADTMYQRVHGTENPYRFIGKFSMFGGDVYLAIKYPMGSNGISFRVEGAIKGAQIEKFLTSRHFSKSSTFHYSIHLSNPKADDCLRALGAFVMDFEASADAVLTPKFNIKEYAYVTV